MAADASMDLEGMAVGSVWSDVASEKKCSLYCNGKKVTPEEDAVQLGSNKTQVPLCVLAYMLHGPSSHLPAVVWEACLDPKLCSPSCHVQAQFYCAQASLHRSPVRCSVQPMPLVCQCLDLWAPAQTVNQDSLGQAVEQLCHGLP